MTEPTAHQRLTRAGLSAGFADLVLERHDREVAEQAEAEQRLARVWSACDQLERAVINADGRLLTAYDRGVDTAVRRIRNALGQPAHDGGPTVQEATNDDRAHWTNKHAGEGP